MAIAAAYRSRRSADGVTPSVVVVPRSCRATARAGAGSTAKTASADSRYAGPIPVSSSGTTWVG
ncbi:hypothetical protein OG402_33770 [Streptomyces anulatus]|uniref:hypothetical protein n=1 Tax=Streptomyces anulatus TaxID=1892 RepID=UPI002253F283|nr:hypothetical protein [Streptomyces anulatus]MCX4605437.1 hypothetical protein [Streptomyces anulatus]